MTNVYFASDRLGTTNICSFAYIILQSGGLPVIHNCKKYDLLPHSKVQIIGAIKCFEHLQELGLKGQKINFHYSSGYLSSFFRGDNYTKSAYKHLIAKMIELSTPFDLQFNMVEYIPDSYWQSFCCSIARETCYGNKIV